ncbi:Uu.00g110200.m01.CDS01 [Anthostomella pinea]|uniref:Uu.00g110200.m01.CDS01 n=1 Tax=Anthostomella pinea TaxID=933095 RepID=A0AAI8VEX7_9PEZI|nr:Uu.00g110200.m01.CDS01 [Anthostomella pinea]
MDELFQKAVKQNEEMRKPWGAVPWKPDEPHPQPHYSFDKTTQTWAVPKAGSPHPNDGVDITLLALYSWNIDFMLPNAKPRMEAALAHLESMISKVSPSTAVVIFLQECIAEDLVTIGEKAWVRDRLYVTDVDNSFWASGHYGTTTLVDRRLHITSCFRAHYEKTRFERDAFCMDISLGKSKDKTVRLCNTHLESLAMEPPFRPPQMQLVSKFMHAKGIHGALAAGDFNAIQPFDQTLHSDNDLKDAYLELGGAEGNDEGYTWGQQAATTLRERFGCSRMDKVYFCGGLKLESFQRFGADIQLAEQEQRQKLEGLGFEKPWITDHLGVMAEVSIVE